MFIGPSNQWWCSVSLTIKYNNFNWIWLRSEAAHHKQGKGSHVHEIKTLSSTKTLQVPSQPPQPLHASSQSLYAPPPQPLHTSTSQLLPANTSQCVSNIVITDNHPPPSLSHAGLDANPNRRDEEAPHVWNIIISVPYLSATSLMALSSQPHPIEQLPMQPTCKKRRGRVQGKTYVVSSWVSMIAGKYSNTEKGQIGTHIPL